MGIPLTSCLCAQITYTVAIGVSSSSVLHSGSNQALTSDVSGKVPSEVYSQPGLPHETWQAPHLAEALAEVLRIGFLAQTGEKNFSHAA